MATGEFQLRSDIEEFPALWRRVVTDPHGFFADMPETGGLRHPAVFLALCAAVNAIGHLLRLHGVGGVLAAFVWQLIGAFVVAAFFVLIAQHLFGGRAGFEPTFRVVAYAWAPLVVLWVPVLGALALLYSAYLIVRGLERVQGLDTTRAVLTLVLGAGALWVVGAMRSGGAVWL